jgi:hypothetical protein
VILHKLADKNAKELQRRDMKEKHRRSLKNVKGADKVLNNKPLNP